ncbi:MAG TPA: YjgN family protein [Dokdonella sp.]|nr:YjgN family protein [Dokdonella sp.]
MNATVMDGVGPLPATERAVPTTVDHRFQFHGDAREYFRIWIVNLALGIVTLGIYSAWAKVRTQRYFYANTRLAGAPFDYQAQPLAILKGRLIALVLFGGYVLAGQFDLRVQLALALLIAVLAPWLVVRGAAFRARYSAWRGINFRFVPDYRQAYIRYLALYLFVPLTLGLMYPFVKAKQKAFLVEQHRYGGVPFRFTATPGDFYPPYLGAFAGGFVWSMLLSFSMIGFVGAHLSDDGTPPPLLAYGFPLLMYAGYFVIYAFLSASITNLVYNAVRLDHHRLRSTLSGAKLLGIYAGNTLAILASAGMLIPWAMIRLARYRAECLALLQAGDLDAFVAAAQNDVDATGAEMDSVFDIDIGL